MIISIQDKKTYQTTMQILKKGGLVVFPTDTVYGLLVDAQNGHAVQKLLEFKNRPKGKPISVFVEDFEMMDRYVYMEEKQKALLSTILPGSFTVVLPSKRKISPFLESETLTLGVRYIEYRPIQELFKLFSYPFTATSANTSGSSPHHTIKTLLTSLSEKKKHMIDLIVDAGDLGNRMPSTVIDLTKDNMNVIRKGDENKKILTYESASEKETQYIAQNLVKTLVPSDKPYVVLLEGELGAGKTQFIKSMGKTFGIKDIVSPSFVIHYEYNIMENKDFHMLLHADMYHIQTDEEFDYLGLDTYLKKGVILCIEWANKLGNLYDELKKKANMIYIKIDYINEKKRRLTINYLF